MVKIGCSGCLLVEQSFFHDDSRMFIDVGGGVTGIRGLYSSFRPTLDGLSLNMGTNQPAFSLHNCMFDMQCFLKK